MFRSLFSVDTKKTDLKNALSEVERNGFGHSDVSVEENKTEVQSSTEEVEQHHHRQMSA